MRDQTDWNRGVELSDMETEPSLYEKRKEGMRQISVSNISGR